MALRTNNDQYHVRTFLDMQKDLELNLKEDYAEDGTWTVAEKKRKLNEGCIAVAAHSTYPPTVEQFIVNSGTAADPLYDLPLPADFLKPTRLFIEGFEYQELTLSDFTRRRNGLTNTANNTNTGATSYTNINFDRFFWWDEAKNSLRINPQITSRTPVELYYVPMPNKLTKDSDISTLIPAFTSLPALWAAWQMLNKDEEQRGRGAAAKADYREGLDELERHRNRNTGNKTLPILMDGSTFPQNSDYFLGRIDGSDGWDRLP
jgi:hypothetical protein